VIRANSRVYLLEILPVIIVSVPGWKKWLTYNFRN
jgi:hypothetical protein